MEVFVVTKIFGVDSVKTIAFQNEKSAREELREVISLLSETGEYDKVVTESGEEYYITTKSDKPEDYMEVVFKKCDIK